MKNIKATFFTFLLYAFSASTCAQQSATSTLDLENAWQQMFVEQSYNNILKSYEPVFQVEQNFSEPVDKQKCSKYYPDLVVGVEKLPMSAALSYWAYRCAEIGRASCRERVLMPV